MTRVATIGVAILARDEARNLAELLPQLDWADERLVVDGGSRDASRDVARRHAATVVERPLDTFAAQRNFAFAQVRSDWTFFIDADERPTRPLVRETLRTLLDTKKSAFRIPIRSRIFGRPFRFSGTQDDRPVRLVRRGRARWVGDVHERAIVDGQVGLLGHRLDHCTLDDLEAFLRKLRRYTALEAAARVASGRAPSALEPYCGPAFEVFRRLVWKQGFLDGPRGWAFCCLSGLSAWVLACEHHRQWREAQGAI